MPIRVFSLDTGIWVCVLAAFLAIQLRSGLDSTLGQDSFQYLSAAQNALDGRLGYTSLVHFDAERSFGVVPAPMVTFPSGYPFAIALVSLTGLSLAAAGLMISLVATAACVPLLAWLSSTLGLSRVVGHAVMAGFVTNAAVIVMATKVGSDSLFTMLILLGIGLLVLARRDLDKRASWMWLAVGLAFGMAYFVRYAALFFIVGLTLLVLGHLLLRNRRLAAHVAIAAAVAGLAALAGIARNIVLVGNWRGGNDKLVSNPIGSVLLETVRGANRLLLGPGSGVAGGTVLPRAALVGLLVAGLVWLMVWLIRHRLPTTPAERPAVPWALANGAGIDLLVLAAVYLACLFYAGLKSVIDYGDPRYIAPVLPLLLLLLGFAMQTIVAKVPERVRRPPVLAFAASLGLYVYLNLLILQAPQQPGWLPVAAALEAKSAGGETVRAAVDEAAGVDGAMIANNGQTIGHLLARRTVSLVGTHFSTIEWNEPSMRETARRFKAKAVVIYAPASAEDWDDGSVIPSDFVRRLARGDAPPWLHLQYRTANLLVYVPRIEGP